MLTHDEAPSSAETNPAPSGDIGVGAPGGGILGARRRLAMISSARRLSRHLPPGLDRGVRELGKAVLDYRGARSAFLRWVAFRPLGRCSGLLLAPFGRARLLVAADDTEIGRVVYASGGYERLYMEVVLTELARRDQLRVDGKLFVDVGANIGTSTVDALVHFGFLRALCFEPDAENHRILRMNLMLNELEHRADHHRAALSDRDGDGVLELATANTADHRLAVAGASSSNAVVRSETVACRRLDSVLAAGDLAPEDIGLVWVDTQGHEGFVLRGAPSVTGAGVPAVIEYWPSVMAATGSLEVLEEIVARDYTTVIDVHLLSHGLADEATTPAAEIGSLRARYGEGGHTDLLLVRSPARRFDEHRG